MIPRPRTALALVAVSAIALTSAATSLGQTAEQDAPRGTMSHHHAHAALAAKAFRGAIDTDKRGAVNRAYRGRLAANLNTPIGWTGSNHPCRAGHMSARAMRGTLESINFVRAMGGIAPVSFSKRLSGPAQKAALIMSANGSLNHDPPRSWACWTRAGHDAAGRSNIAYSYPTITAGGAIRQYMDDGGSGNEVVGHRRWIMYPPTLKMGNGMTATTNALTVFGGASSSTRPNPRWVSWPTAGWFPGPIEPAGRWSLSSGAGADFSQARVRVEAGGSQLPVQTYPVVNGYGAPTIVFQVSDVHSPGSYTVTVRGIRLSGRSTPVNHQYKVRLFRPFQP
ncbi:MAG TPA: CAP domain-containing protein [Nocardioidaceae bacterium]|nr:CAP domain-containing protein [Nocardioidaceae bacterium]